MTRAKSQKERIGILASVAVIAIGMFAVGNSYATGSLWGIGSAQISIDEAAAIGISNLKTDSSNLKAISMERDEESFIYDLEFEIGDQEVSVQVDPQSGEVLDVEQNPLDVEMDDDVEIDDDVEANDGNSVSDGDGETDDD